METYLLGVAVALLLGFVKVGAVIASLPSTRAKNLETIGLYYRYSTGDFDATKPPGVFGFIGVALWVLVVAPLGSWLSVASAAWGYIRFARARAALPEGVKAIHFRIAHQRLTKDEMIEQQEDLARLQGIPGPVRTGGEDDEEPTLLVLENSSGWYSEVRAADPERKTLTYCAHPDDYLSVFNSTEEYRFEGNQVLTRLIEDYTEHPGEEVWHVKDGVILESEIRQRHEQSKVPQVRSIEEELARYASQVQWHPIENRMVRFFVMAQHPSMFPMRERRRIIRSELERLEASARKLRDVVTANGLELHETEEGTNAQYPDTFSDEDRKRIQPLFSDEKLREEVGITLGELHQLKVIRADLLELLGEPVTPQR